MADITLHRFATSASFESLQTAIDWQQRSVMVYGKTYPQPRLTKWYGPVSYLYSGLAWAPAPMPPILEEIRSAIEAQTRARFNSVLCNMYRDGADCVGWHSDDEALFGSDPIVASVSFGATRTFKIRSKDSTEKMDFDLFDKSLLVMGKGVQAAYQHAILRTKKPVGPRINLTYRLTV